MCIEILARITGNMHLCIVYNYITIESLAITILSISDNGNNDSSNSDAKLYVYDMYIFLQDLF
jgi:hypothetical protein